MLYLLDTNTISRLMRRDVRVASRAASIAKADEAITCVIVRGEVLLGIELAPIARKRSEFETMAKMVFDVTRCIDVPQAAVFHYASIKMARKRAGRPIQENDLWIASTAMAVGAVLVSHDNDMKGIAGLNIEDWW